MTRIDATFERLAKVNKKAFVAYIMAGDPTYDASADLMAGLPAAGVDIIELGLPSQIQWQTGQPFNSQVKERLTRA